MPFFYLILRKVTHVYYEDCSDHALRIKIDFEEFPFDPIFKVAGLKFAITRNIIFLENIPIFCFQTDLTSLEEITFLNVHSVALYLKSSLDWGNVTIRLAIKTVTITNR